MAHHSTHVDASGVCTINAVVQPGGVKIWAMLWPKEPKEGLFAPFAPFPSESASWNDLMEMSADGRYHILVFVLRHGDVL